MPYQNKTRKKNTAEDSLELFAMIYKLMRMLWCHSMSVVSFLGQLKIPSLFLDELRNHISAVTFTPSVARNLP